MKKKVLLALFFMFVAFGARLIPLKIPNVEFISSLIAFLILAFGLKVSLPAIFVLVLLSDFVISGKLQLWEVIVLSGWLAVIVTQWFLRGKRFLNIFLMEIIGTLAFFFVTNSLFFFVFNIYPKTISGYFMCLVAGIPFLRNQMIGNGIFSYIVYLTFNFALGTEKQTQGSI